MFKNTNFDEAARVLKVEDLHISLADGTSRSILNGVSINIRRGETVCLVGESGSGKSVSSLAIMGLLPKNQLAISGGSIELEGQNLLKLSPKAMRDARARKVSMIFQEPMTALNPVMRVGDQIIEVMDTHTRLSRKEKQERVFEMIRQVHLKDVERIYRSYPHQLSGGERQRIMIAMALILEPKLLIADEPTTALDVTTQNQILKLISELQQKHNTAVLFITHDMGVVSEIADTVYVMNQGRVVEFAPVETLLTSPRDNYTRGLLKSVPSLIPRPSRPDYDHNSVLVVKDLAKAYVTSRVTTRPNSNFAARHISFSINKGRTLGIVGESGSGKSTVARCILRLVDPTDGEIWVTSTNMAKLSHRELRPQRKRVQIVFQDPFRSLNPRWTIGASLIESQINFGSSKQDALEHAGELLELVGLSKDALARYPHQFSGGQRQRIAIARAVATRPDILVADEAVSALDVSIQAQILKLLDELQKKFGLTILFITHDLRVAAQICDDVLVMRNGRLVEYDTVSNILLTPKQEYTRALIDAAPGRHWDFANFRPIGKHS